MQKISMGAPVLRDDGLKGTITSVAPSGEVSVTFVDGMRLSVLPEHLVLQTDGVYRLPEGVGEIVIDVIAEELSVEKELVARGRVRVHKRIETFDEIVNTPTFREDVRVERVSINKLIEDVVPEPREEDGVLIIPILEEVVVTETRLMLREEVRVYKQRTQQTDSKTVTLRREVVDIEREDLGEGSPGERSSQTGRRDVSARRKRK
jgi:uncharacterized protein (TIGR02271 family)